MLQVGEHQLLVLLFVAQAGRDQRDGLCQHGLIGSLEKARHRGVDVPDGAAPRRMTGA
ncbi:MAG: hypothetical protein OZ924_15395 [Burkholderiaceae bacterium]|nr:hypothetical protein [Burkholderiaceae bacterium]MEB2352783.1 hypothetical protein [Burkholderiaceae bacterium]